MNSNICLYTYICIKVFSLEYMLILYDSTRTRLKSHVWRAPRKTQVTSRRWSHITDIIFWKNSLRAPMNPANRIIIFISIRIKKSLRARSPYAIFERNACIIHSCLHWGAGFDRLVVYASIIAIYIGALILTGWCLRINHGHLHWGAGLDRLVVYASIMAIYIGALVLTGWLSHWFPTSFQCFHWFPQGERGFFQNKWLKHLGVRGTKPCGRAVKINNLVKDLYYLD